jgi:putative restriction endonuclease
MSEASSEVLDRQVRLAAFEFLTEQTHLHGETLSWARLLQGFDFRGRRVPLVSQPGIFKPAILPEVPLTIRTAPEEEARVRPYADEMDSEGRLRYRYRGTDPHHPDNVGLRRAMQRRLPLIYLFGVIPGQYMPVWPVYVVGDEPATLSFLVSVDEQTGFSAWRGQGRPANFAGLDGRQMLTIERPSTASKCRRLFVQI